MRANDPVGEAGCPTCGENRKFLWAIPRNRLLLLSFLVLLVLFYFTSRVVKAYHAKEVQLGRAWYMAGERDLAAGRAAAALTDFRSALVYTPDDADIELHLAQALAAAGRRSEAHAYLLSLWEKEPGDGMVNLELARLAAASDSLPEVIRYYHNAIYGQWEGDAGRQRRQVRVQLAEFLLGVGQKGQAQAELLALTADLPNDPQLAIQAGALLLKTGGYDQADILFRRALRLQPDDPPALEGMGEASFGMGNYRDARRYLTRAKRQGPLSAYSQSLLETSTLILDMDPLTPRLPAEDRVERTLRAFDQGLERLSGCLPAGSETSPPGPSPSDLQKLNAQALALKPKVRERNLLRDPDLVLQVTDLVFEIEKAAETACGEPQGADLALLLLSHLREGRNE